MLQLRNLTLHEVLSTLADIIARGSSFQLASHMEFLLSTYNAYTFEMVQSLPLEAGVLRAPRCRRFETLWCEV